MVIEATNVYHLGVAQALTDRGIAVSSVNPAQTHAYKRATGSRAKTDAQDAQALLRYATQVRPDPTSLPSPRQRDLAELQTCRDGLTEMLIATKNRAHTATAATAAHDAAMGDRLKTERDAVDAHMRELVAADPDLEARRQIIDSMPGVGGVTSLALVARLPELGMVDAKTIAALAGVAPHPQDSGVFRGQRRCTGGRRAVTSAVYQMAFVAARHNPVIRHHATQLKTRKPYKVAIIACARRMLGILTTMLRDHLTWDQTRVAQGAFLA